MTLAQCISGLFDRPAVLTAKPTRPDATDIAKAVYRYSQVIGCNESNTIAAIASALKETSHTLAAIRAGKRRADQLRYREKLSQPSPPTSA